jgi:hypothetical protein
MLPLLAVNAILMMAIALGLRLSNVASPQVIAHIAFALGIMPLILAAIAYFVPVLTRSGPAPRWLAGMPFFAWLGGICMVAGFLGALPLAAAAYAGALLALLAALTMLAWVRRRGKHGLGPAHPGLAWYLAAVAFLAAALATVPLMALWPEQWSTLRLIHLHANLLGFVGLTAIGTLQVLLPTAAGRADPGAASRLAQDLKFAVAGVAMIALGAAWSTLLAIIGAALFLMPLVRMGTRWAAGFDDQIGRLHGAAPSLALACFGLVGLLFAGFGHARGFLSGRDAAVGFVVAFLLPLVTGAATQLLPVWLRPGLKQVWHEQLRNRLGRYSGLRATLLVAGGLAAAFGWPEGLWLAALGVALFVGALLASARMWR